MVLSPVYRWAMAILIAGVVLFLLFNPLPVSQFQPSSDEGYYYQYASIVMHQGHQAFHGLMAWYISNKEALMHPLPVRVGYMLLSALLFKFCGGANFGVLAFISTASFILFLAVCFNYVRKYFDLDTSLLTLLLLASSPLMLGLSRRAMTDSANNLCWGLTVWLFLDVLLKPERFSYICFLISLILAISFKETAVILIPFFVMAGIWGKRKGLPIEISQIAGIVLVPLIFFLCFYGWIYGGLGAVITLVFLLIKTLYAAHYFNPYAVYFCSGPWFRYLLDFLLLTPLVTILFIGYLGYLCARKSPLDFKRAYFLAYFIYVYAVSNSVAHSKVVRYVVNLEMVLGLFAVLMMQEMFKGVDVKKQQHYLFCGALGIFIFNLCSFSDLFYKPSLLDPITCHLLVLRHLIPG